MPGSLSYQRRNNGPNAISCFANRRAVIGIIYHAHPTLCPKKGNDRKKAHYAHGRGEEAVPSFFRYHRSFIPSVSLQQRTARVETLIPPSPRNTTKLILCSPIKKNRSQKHATSRDRSDPTKRGSHVHILYLYHGAGGECVAATQDRKKYTVLRLATGEGTRASMEVVASALFPRGATVSLSPLEP